MRSGLCFEGLTEVGQACAKGDKKARCFGGTAVQRAEAVELRLQSSNGAKLRS